ncbi:MAG TPA: conjugal transfer protein TrbF [Candidatus Competibacteraceae bacterium]|nr:conjugal transfer protein TrbF [Candidatus Competibacteraceae bacterium]
MSTPVRQESAAVSRNDNPYLTARRAWNEHVGGVVSSRQTWQVIGILSLLIALAGVGGMIYIGSQSKFVPYVIEVDKLGQAVAVAPADKAAPVDARVVHASVAAFIADARLVTPDTAVQRNAIFRVYAMLAPNDPATAKMTEWLNGTPESSPFKRAAKETVTVEITSVLPQSSETWQVDWVETARDRQGIIKVQPFRMRALVTVYVVPPTSQTTEEQIRRNPIGIYVRDFSWSKQT